MKNQLLITLEIIQALGIQSASSAELERRFDLSSATLKRHLKEARLLGADVESFKTRTGWMYLLKNKDAVYARVHQWIQLEKTRDLTK